ncbi:MAG: hypothetical protein ACRDGG_04975 [Anaerolineae bacterium]
MTGAGAHTPNRALILLALIVVLAGVLRFVDLEHAPVGGHGDVAWIGINALDWVDRGIWPYYIRELYAPEPVIVYLTGLAVPLTGVSYLAPRLVTAIFGLLLVVFLCPATWWLLDDAPRAFRERASLLASLAAGVSLHAVHLSRLGMESPLFPATLALFVWLMAWAWRRGGCLRPCLLAPRSAGLLAPRSAGLPPAPRGALRGWLRWTLAGAALAFTQYIYLPARLLPIVLALWIAHSAWADRERLRAQWRGLVLMAVVAFVLTLPNIILFITTPEAFSARADLGAADTGGWIWNYDTGAQGGLLAALLQKLGVIVLAFGIYWDGPYTVMNQPMLGPLFFVGFLLALGAWLRWPRRIAYAWPLLAIPVLLITDLISGAVVEAHALHQIGILPFVYILAGVGLAHLWEALHARLATSTGRRVLTVGLLALALGPSVWGMHRYLTAIIPGQYADPETGWRLEQTDVDIGRRLIAEPDRAYLVPYAEYNRSNVAWVTSRAFRERRSAIDPGGILRLPELPGRLTVVMPADPYRIRHDGAPPQFDTRLWVMLVDRQTWLLPPLTRDQEQRLFGFIETAESEALLDRSETKIATLFSGPAPRDLFTPHPVIDYPLDATFSAEIQLLGYTLPGPDLTPGAVTFVTLYWRALNQRPGEDYEVFVQVWNDAGEAIANSHDFPYGGMYRSRIWQPTEVVATHHWFILPDDLPAGRYTLVAGLFRLLQNQRVPATGASVDMLHRVARAPDLRRPPPPPTEFGARPARPIRFGETFGVAGWDVALDGVLQPIGNSWDARPGQTLTLDVTWEALIRPPLDYSTFLHLSATSDAPPLAQVDRPLGGSYPSAVWRAGDHVADRLALPLPSDLGSGEYTLWLGIYYWQTGERLAAIVDGAEQADARVRVGSVVIP